MREKHLSTTEPNSNEVERFIPAKEIMRRLSISRCKADCIIRELEARGGSVCRLGRVVRVKETAFNEWVSAHISGNC